jgi:protein-tyrosine phosphatase
MSIIPKIEYIDCSSTDYDIVKYCYNIYTKTNCGILKHFLNKENIFEADEILHGLYIGNIYSVYDSIKLKNIGITHIISVLSGFDPPYPDTFNYLILNALDNTNTHLSQNFEKTNKFIEEAFSENGKILIHCQAGRSRSATILAAYIIKTFGMPVDITINLIKSKRNIIEPNSEFINQLREYYKLNYDIYYV